MRLFRLAKARHEHTSLENESVGAQRAGGRWNSKGTAVVYSSCTIATAALETLVRLDWDLAPAFVLLAIDVPGNLEMDVIDQRALPRNWMDFPAPGTLAGIGDEWVKQGHALMLEVPSVASPYERNVLLNPAHPDAGRCSITVLGPYPFDGRLEP
ncbi:RES family NAD+ phosphorylase [Acidihalobacter ferrooxydans]|uniref:RES domain-containing protein n=1 Tax=Acidihalobacter ferrooxydans TaxID=1765967 RepID=A0A1P8UDU5_9GAMM|nr:RES family NAD+ phosphorylase [Acidihalobacter ferrooxydans]APZ41976.1 hypothetical protein BW247_01750 [Acidihalobacter ferrooxydans]